MHVEGTSAAGTLESPKPKDERGLEPVETLSTLYLVLPLFVFFATFIRLEIAVPACALIGWQIYEICRRTRWRNASAILSWPTLWFLIISAALLCWSYGVGPLKPNADWPKHYSILNTLVEHSWPPTIERDGAPDLALRYYLGWYLIPALFLKAVNLPLQEACLISWSVLGLVLFFNLLGDLVGKGRAAAIAAVAFILFGGADFVGWLLRGDWTRYPEAFEWWTNWIQYSSTVTSIAWTPQHALPAWLGIALLMKQRTNRALLPFGPLLLCAAFFWSPFAGLGLVPFWVALTLTYGPKATALNWRTVACAILVAVPVAIFFISSAGNIPKGFAGSFSCELYGGEALCFSWPHYALFLLIEVAAPFLILFLRRENEQGFLVTAAITLCLIPLYKMGLFNDFALRTSIPSIAVLAILCAKTLVSGWNRYAISVLVILTFALPGVYAVLKIPLKSRFDPPQTETFDDRYFQTAELGPLASQYFAPLPVWVLR